MYPQTGEARPRAASLHTRRRRPGPSGGRRAAPRRRGAAPADGPGRDGPRAARYEKREGERCAPPPCLACFKRARAVHRSAAPCSPTGFPRSTIGAVRLSFRVRNGTGRAPHAMAADRWAALGPPTRVTRACPEGRTATSGDGTSIDLTLTTRHLRYLHVWRPAGRMRVRARAISTARLRGSRPLHLRPIDQVVYLGPYRKEN